MRISFETAAENASAGLASHFRIGQPGADASGCCPIRNFFVDPLLIFRKKPNRSRARKEAVTLPNRSLTVAALIALFEIFLKFG